MSMGISSLSSLNTLNRTQRTMNQSIQRIASGSQHPNAAYGPSAYAITQRTYSNIGAAQQANANTQNANAMLNVAAGGASNAVSALSSLRSTLLEAANGTNGSQDTATLQKTVNQTIATLNDNVASTTYNGKTLLDGSQSVNVQGIFGYDTVNIGNLTSQGLGLTDEQGNSTLDLSSTDGIRSSLDTVDKALNSALDQTTSIGAAQQGLGYQSANTTTVTENLYDTASTMDDTDIAKEITNLTSAKTQQQLALFGTKMNMVNRASVLSLLS